MSVRWNSDDEARIQKRLAARRDTGRFTKADLKPKPERPAAAPDQAPVDSTASVDPLIRPKPPVRLKMTGNLSLDKAIKKIAGMVEDRDALIKLAPSKPKIRRPKGLPLADTRFADRCLAYGIPRPVVEHIFHPTRRWRFDWAWPDQKVAVEQEGGIYTRGRHVRPKGFIADMEKYNSAQLLGWIVLRYEPDQLYTALPEIKRALGC